MLELTLVLVVIGVMLAVVIPGMLGQSTDGGLKRTVRLFTGMLAEGRNAVLMRGSPASLNINLATGQVTLTGQDVDKPGPSMRLPQGLAFAGVRYPGERTVAEGVAQIRLQGGGLAEPALIGLLAGGEAWTLQVQAGDARVVLYKNLVDFGKLREAEVWLPLPPGPDEEELYEQEGAS